MHILLQKTTNDCHIKIYSSQIVASAARHTALVFSFITKQIMC